MEGKLSITRSFFKVMMPGFQEKLNLPPAFCKKLKQEKSEWAMLRSRKGMWKINICRNSEGLICFKDGWPQFVDHHSLRIGDFVMFEYTGELNFNVFVFDPTACEREFLVESKREHEAAANTSYHPKITRRETDKESVISYHSQNPYFVVTIKPSHLKGHVTIPAEFMRANNLAERTNVTLRDARKRAWPVKLRTRRFSLRMGKGWHDFYVSNELKDGHVCVFDLNRPSLRCTTVLFDVHVFPAPQ